MTRRGDMRKPEGPRYSSQAFDLNCYGVWDHYRGEWVTGQYFTGRQRRSQADKAAAALNAQNGSRS